MAYKLLVVNENICWWEDLQRLAEFYEIEKAVDISDVQNSFLQHELLSAVLLCVDNQSTLAYSVLQQAKANSILSLIPIVGITDNVSNENIMQLFADGITACIPRTMDIAVITKQIDNLIKFNRTSKSSSSKCLKSIMNNLAGGISALELSNENMKMLFFNEKFEKITGINQENQVQFISRIFPQDLEKILSASSSLQIGGETVVEYRFNRVFDSKEIWLRQYLTKTKLPDIKADVLLGTLEDITAIKESEQKLLEWQKNAKLRDHLLDDSSSAVMVVDAKTKKMLYINRTCAELWGKNPEEACGKKCYSFLKGKNNPCEHCRMSRASDTRFCEYEFTDENSKKHYHVNAKYIDWDGKRAYVEYYSDETILIEQRMKLLASNHALQTASRNTGVSFWEYDLDKKVVDWGLFGNNTYAGYPKSMKNIPYSMIENEYTHPEDVNKFLKMHQDLDSGAESSECTVRLMNLKNKQYNCYHIIYTRLHDPFYTTRKAVGFVENVDIQMEIKSRYEKELQLRNELIKDSAIYYEIDITNNHLIEYYSKYKDVPSMKSNIKLTEKMRQEILERTYEEDREYVRDNLFSAALNKAYNQGITSKNLLYRRYVNDADLSWVNVSVALIKHPDADRVVAFICLRDVNEEELEKIALTKTIDKDIESLSIINVKSGMTRLLKTNNELNEFKPNEYFSHDRYIEKVIAKRLIEEDREKCSRFLKLKSLIRELKTDSTVSIVFSVIDRNGEIRRKRTVAYYLDNLRKEIVLVRRDITDLYEEDQRQQALLKATADAANKANRAKSEFLSRMSHDMRTPMNAILGMTYLAKEEKPAGKTLEYLENIDASGKYLLGLINDVLDLSKIESEKVELKEESFELAEFLNGIETIIGPLMKEKNIQFDVKMECGVNNIIVDKLRFNQIFYNLLSNAAKYTPEGGEVVFSAEHLPDRDGKHGMRYHVIDNGIGMSEEFMKLLFTPFHQEHNPALPEQSGTGLGLAIVKNLVELMGGNIWAKSELGKGSEFIVDLYAYETDVASTGDESLVDDYSILDGMHVLAVDDNELNLVVVESILKHKGCIVTLSRNGAEAVESFVNSENGFFDVILMDLRMPVMDGIKATEEIRALKREDAKTIPIIAFSADAFGDDRERTEKAGMNEYLTKPVEPKVLFETFVKMMKLKNIGVNIE